MPTHPTLVTVFVNFGSKQSTRLELCLDDVSPVPTPASC